MIPFSAADENSWLSFRAALLPGARQRVGAWLDQWDSVAAFRLAAGCRRVNPRAGDVRLQARPPGFSVGPGLATPPGRWYRTVALIVR